MIDFRSDEEKYHIPNYLLENFFFKLITISVTDVHMYMLQDYKKDLKSIDTDVPKTNHDMYALMWQKTNINIYPYKHFF